VNYIMANLKLCAGLYLTTAIGKHMHNLLLDKLRLTFPNVDQSRLELLVSEITYPEKHTPLAESRLDLLDLGIEVQERKIKPDDIHKFQKISNKFEIYYKKYHFVPVNFNEDPWTRREILQQIRMLQKSDCKKEKKSLVDAHKDRTKIARKKLKEINNPEINQLAKVLQTGTSLNESRKYVFCRASLAYRPLFKKIAAKNQLSGWKECWKLTPEEIFELHFENNHKILRALNKRAWAGIIYSSAEPGYEILGKKAVMPFIAKTNSLKKENKISDSVEIKGSIANGGKVTGRAKIIMGKSDFGKFKSGDIIVTAMTSVDFIPLMERAGAFVTNEGGITSHASIVSRELNKPCIIGTKIATKILKDGDLVEVDADRGVIRIIKKSKHKVR